MVFEATGAVKWAVFIGLMVAPGTAGVSVQVEGVMFPNEAECEDFIIQNASRVIPDGMYAVCMPAVDPDAAAFGIVPPREK